jgi:hypothetical protein
MKPLEESFDLNCGTRDKSAAPRDLEDLLKQASVDYISHSIDDGVLCMNVCFKDKTLFSFRFACDMFIVGADLSDWKTGTQRVHFCE